MTTQGATVTNQIRVFDSFADMINAADDGVDSSALTIKTDVEPLRGRIEIACANALEGTGVQYAGREPSGFRAGVSYAYALVPQGEEVDGASAIAKRIARLGPGRWTSIGFPVSPLTTGAAPKGTVRGRMVGGRPHVLMGAYYFHAPREVK